MTRAGAAPVVLSLDVGGSSVKSGLVTVDGALPAGPFLAALDSRGPATGIVATLAEALTRLLERAAGREVLGVGVSMPGPFDYESGVSRMRGLGKFETIHGLALAREVAARETALAGLRWRWLNDARAFALGELRHGAAAGAKRAIFLTLGTGCGSAFAVDDRLVTDGAGVPDGGYVYALRHGEHNIDELLSARGLLGLWHEVAKGDERGPSVRTAGDVGRLAQSGDPRALEALRRFGVLIASALAPVFTEFEPDVIVLGGRVSRSLPYFGPAARAAGAPPLVAAAEPDVAALRGAALHFLEGR